MGIPSLAIAFSCAPLAAQEGAHWTEARLATVPEDVSIATDLEPATNDGTFVRRNALRWSPDGRRVAYAGVRAGAWFPVVGDELGDASFRYVSAPRFGGQHVFFHVARTKSESEQESWLWVDGQRVGPEDWMGPFAVSADGERVAFWTQPGARYGNAVPAVAAKHHLVVVREVKRDTWRATRARTEWVACGAPAPLFLEDDETVLTCALKPAGWVPLTAKGKRERELSDPVATLLDLDASPDGKRLALLFREAGGTDAALTFRDRPLGEAYADPSLPTVGPDGRRVAFAIGVEGGRTVALDGEETEYAPRGDHVTALAFDPEGRRVAFVAVVGGREAADAPGVLEAGAWFVCVRPVEGDDPWTEEQRFLEIRDLTWSAGGTHLAYAARGEDGWRIVAGERESPPFDDVGAPRFAPDDSTVGFGARSGDELWWRVLPLD